MYQVTFEFETKKEAEEAVFAVAYCMRKKPEQIDVANDGKRESPLIMEERW